MSPYTRYLKGCEEGVLQFQRDTKGNAIFPPRVEEASDNGPLQWAVSKGAGVVYSITIVYPRNGDAFYLVLINLDEGFRMMSRVVENISEKVSIGDRVKVKFCNLKADGPVLPVFEKEGQTS